MGIIAPYDMRFHFLAHLIQPETQIAQYLGRYSFALANQPKKEVFSGGILAIRARCLFLSQRENRTCSFSEPVKSARVVVPHENPLSS